MNFILFMKQIKTLFHFIYHVQSQANEIITRIEQIQLSIPDCDDFKSSLSVGPSVQAEKSRLYRKPVRILKSNKYSEAENKSSNVQNFTMKDQKTKSLFESKLNEIEYSVKKENLVSEANVKLALKALSNVPYRSSHPINK